MRSAEDGRFTCLSEAELFADLLPREVGAVNHMLPLTPYRNGELVHGPAQGGSSLFILKKGRVRVFRIAPDGKGLTLGILEPGAVFGEMPLLGQRMHGSCAEAIGSVSLCRLSAAEVEQLLLTVPRIAVRMARLLGDHVGRLEDRLADLALKSLRSRAAATLVRLAADQGRGPLPLAKPTIRLTHGQIAGLLGVTRESTSRTLQVLADDGLIRQSRGKILVLDMDGLRHVADQIG